MAYSVNSYLVIAKHHECHSSTPESRLSSECIPLDFTLPDFKVWGGRVNSPTKLKRVSAAQQDEPLSFKQLILSSVMNRVPSRIGTT